MTKKEVLQDIDKLCGDIANWTTEVSLARCNRDDGRLSTAHWAQEGMMVAARQELSMLRDYIEENVKE